MDAIEAVNIELSFGGVKALDGVSVSAAAETVTGLIGPNGAGKTTMLGVLSGLLRPEAGRVTVQGHDVTRLGPSRRAKLGISRTFQRIQLWESMTVEQNVRTAADFAAGWHSDWDAVQACSQAIEAVGIDSALRDSAIGQLSTGQARLVELARALAQGPRILLLDEPTAGLDREETRRLVGLLQTLSENGMAICIVEHHIDVVLSVCSWVWVLDFGELIAGGTPEEVRNNESVKIAYLGTRYANRD